MVNNDPTLLTRVGSSRLPKEVIPANSIADEQHPRFAWLA
jgi:hypothetical protein